MTPTPTVNHPATTFLTTPTASPTHRPTPPTMTTLDQNAAEDLLPERFQPVALLLAFLLPGLGHWYLGLRRRARLIALGVLGLFACGLLTAGIDAVDSGQFYMPASTTSPPIITPVDRELVGIIGTLFVGPVAIAVDQLHQRRFKVLAESYLGGRPVLIRRNAKPFEIRDPATGLAIAVREPITGNPIEFKDPATGSKRLSTLADRPPNVPSLGRMREIGGLFTCLAGMLNLIAMVDAAWGRKRSTDPDARRR